MKNMPTHAWKKNPIKHLRLLGALICGLSGCTASPAAREPEDFSARVLQAVRSMPTGGGYAADRTAELRLAAKGITHTEPGKLHVNPQAAAPTFCSAACYIVLLKVLQKHYTLSPGAWESLRVERDHPDGYLSWGRVNANGPGLAKWVHDLGAGCNFTEIQQAKPGDFLKFFHTAEIGAGERGHMVIYLRTEQINGEPHLVYWSANSPGGYGARSIPLRKLHHPIFTRITRPERLSAAPSLPIYDPWLASMLLRSYSYAEVLQHCGAQPRPTQP